MVSMTTLHFTVQFLTPAFLGDAKQNGRWRTPPIKALLRQWWRVAYAADHNFNVNVEEMRQEEGLLFGNAWLENEFRKSLLRLRLDRWDEGKETKQSWGRQELDKTKEGVSHPEVGTIGPTLYLGYGPLIVEKVPRQGEKKAQYATVLKNNAAIQAGEQAKLSVAWPTQHPSGEVQKILDNNNQKRRIERALGLMHRYGTLGGRSRNGWGSFELLPMGGTAKLTGQVPLRPWKDCFNCDWPHAIGLGDDGKPLIWQTEPHDDWKSLMKTLAIIKIGLRTQFNFRLDKDAGDEEKKDKHDNPRGIDHGRAQDRHWLSYPVTKHDVQDWKRNNLRLPNQLRFKVRVTPDGKRVGVIFHMPHLPPDAFHPNRPAIENVWRKVHQFLDEPAQKLTRIPE